MGSLVIYSENSSEHRYTICQDEESNSYFLVIDDQPYKEEGHLFEGSFDDVHDKLRDLRAAEDLKTI